MRADLDRRTFLKITGAAGSISACRQASAADRSHAVAIEIDHESPIANSESVSWALGRLQDELRKKGLATAADSSTLRIVISQQGSPLANSFSTTGQSISQPETVALLAGSQKAVPSILVTGVDARGMVYGLLELADDVRYSDDPMRALATRRSTVETTPNRVRSVARPFLSEIEDKAWFYDHQFWIEYLDRLAAARFNRFNFALGFGYDFPRGVTGDYLHFPYPYLVEVPGYEQVHVEPALQPGERDRNLETLQFIAAETARRGLEFQLGLWTHAYEWVDSPKADHRIVGLNPQIHAPYCRDALAVVLNACPQITGLTFRIHGESGIPERSYPFWETLFEAITRSGRTLEIEMHAKGLDSTMIEIARKTGMPVKAGAKFWAEHQGLAYHQADIRATEYPKTGVTGTFTVSSGERNFTRYGYGDFYGQDSISVLYRVWPGTQRHLLWADPALASGYGNAAHFCGAAGMELCEPLTFKGREGSGHPGGRNAYADQPLVKLHPDSEKFALTYLMWGRYLYNPSSAPAFYRRVFRQNYGEAGLGLESALSNSSRILPLVTTAWLPSASNHSLWIELFTPISILPIRDKPIYSDSPAPHNVSVISPLDPQIFLTIDQYAKNLIEGSKNGHYNHAEVADAIEGMVARSNHSLTVARSSLGKGADAATFRQAEEDIRIVNGVGLYFANLFRTALYYSLFERTGDPSLAKKALASYRDARNAWAGMAARASKVYRMDVSYGSVFVRRGHWADRLPMIDRDLAALTAYFNSRPQQATKQVDVAALLKQQPRPVLEIKHAAPSHFVRGEDLTLSIETPRTVNEVTLWYRHVNQAERWRQAVMTHSEGTFKATVPGAYTDSQFPFQYYFELKTQDGATLHPAFNTTFSNQPYFALTSDS
jgi:hypothetical protein